MQPQAQDVVGPAALLTPSQGHRVLSRVYCVVVLLSPYCLPVLLSQGVFPP